MFCFPLQLLCYNTQCFLACLHAIVNLLPTYYGLCIVTFVSILNFCPFILSGTMNMIDQFSFMSWRKRIGLLLHTAVHVYANWQKKRTWLGVFDALLVSEFEIWNCIWYFKDTEGSWNNLSMSSWLALHGSLLLISYALVQCTCTHVSLYPFCSVLFSVPRQHVQHLACTLA